MQPLVTPGFVDAVINTVCADFDCKRKDVLGPSRPRFLVVPRFIIMFLLRKAKLSFPEIGQKVGGKDHSTVMSAVRKVERQMLNDVAFRDRVNALSDRLNLGDRKSPDAFIGADI